MWISITATEGSHALLGSLWLTLTCLWIYGALRMPSRTKAARRPWLGAARTRRRCVRSRYVLRPDALDHAKLRRSLQSTLEFELRLQEYIELARARRSMEAIAYSKKYLVSWHETHLDQIHKAIALLAFPTTTTCGPYKASCLPML